MPQKPHKFQKDPKFFEKSSNLFDPKCDDYYHYYCSDGHFQDLYYYRDLELKFHDCLEIGHEVPVLGHYFHFDSYLMLN